MNTTSLEPFSSNPRILRRLISGSTENWELPGEIPQRLSLGTSNQTALGTDEYLDENIHRLWGLVGIGESHRSKQKYRVQSSWASTKNSWVVNLGDLFVKKARQIYSLVKGICMHMLDEQNNFTNTFFTEWLDPLSRGHCSKIPGNRFPRWDGYCICRQRFCRPASWCPLVWKTTSVLIRLLFVICYG